MSRPLSLSRFVLLLFKIILFLFHHFFFFTFSLVVVVEGISGSRETTWFAPDDSRADSLMRHFLSGCRHFERAETPDHWSCDGAVVSGCRWSGALWRNSASLDRRHGVLRKQRNEPTSPYDCQGKDDNCIMKPKA